MTTSGTTNQAAGPGYEPPAIHRREAVGEVLIGVVLSSDPGGVFSAHFER
jgi:hypothetical protein